LFADWASIISLIISGYAAIQITLVKRRVVANLTLEPLLGRLRANSKEMNRCLSDYGSYRGQFDEVLGLMEANVRALRRRLGARYGWFCRRPLAAIRVYRLDENDAGARTVYNALQQVVQEVANLVEEMRITGP
jgi:hypothetical protein